MTDVPSVFCVGSTPPQNITFSGNSGSIEHVEDSNDGSTPGDSSKETFHSSLRAKGLV
jgi:hypothetical protein